MELLLAAGYIFILRLIDQSLGTLRTLYVNKGKPFFGAILGFIESGIWIIAISQVIKDLNDRTLKTISNELPTPTATLEGLTKLLSFKSRQGLNKSTMTEKEAKEYDDELEAIETRLEELTGLRKPTKKTLPNF